MELQNDFVIENGSQKLARGLCWELESRLPIRDHHLSDQVKSTAMVCAGLRLLPMVRDC